MIVCTGYKDYTTTPTLRLSGAYVNYYGFTDHYKVISSFNDKHTIIIKKYSVQLKSTVRYCEL